MRRLISTHLFRRERLTSAHLERLHASGVEGIELFCARPSFDYHDRGQMAELAGWLRQSPLQVHSLHSPIYGDEREGRSGEPPINVADADPRRRLAALDEIQRALEFSERVPFRYLIQHLGPPRVEWDLHQADRALTSLEKIRLLAKSAGVTVLVENIPNGQSQPRRLLSFLESNHMNDVGVCFDSGHANIRAELFGGGDTVEAWETLCRRVHSTHLHDNQGSSDDHLWPGDGAIAWTALAPALLAKGPDLPWVLEVGPHANTPELADRLRRCFAFLEYAGSNPAPA